MTDSTPTGVTAGASASGNGPAGSADVDPACAAGVELARAAALDVGGDDVGDHLGCETVAVPADDGPAGHVVDHYFACRHPGYRGWRWCVTVARAADTEAVTVDEVALLPGDEAVLAPDWVPWAERVRAGDLGPGDLIATPPDDPRLVPSFAAWLADRTQAAELDLDPLDDPAGDTAAVAAYERGIGRPRVLSPAGREEAADRWSTGEAGPEAPIARQAPGRCGTCGFYLPLAGSLGRAFGACANEVAPDDGRVVAADHGCGAHSEAVELPGLPQAEAPPPLLDDYRYEYEVTPV